MAEHEDTQEIAPETVAEIRRQAGKKVGEASRDEVEALMAETGFDGADSTRAVDISELQKRLKDSDRRP